MQWEILCLIAINVPSAKPYQGPELHLSLFTTFRYLFMARLAGRMYTHGKEFLAFYKTCISNGLADYICMHLRVHVLQYHPFAMRAMWKSAQGADSVFGSTRQRQALAVKWRCALAQDLPLCPSDCH